MISKYSTRLIFKTISTVIIVVIITALSGCASVEKAFPTRDNSARADTLAQKIMNATGYEQWQQTGAIQWEFPGGHSHLWDKHRNYAKVEWKKHRVILDLGTKKGRAWKDGVEVQGDDLEKLLAEAWQFWANDSFWLNPFAKFFDNGVERSIVTTKSDEEALLVTYSSGGTTPGDSYLWVPDENGLPYEGRMWVQIIPIKGFTVSWESWQDLDTGSKVATEHKFAFINLKLSNVKAASTLEELVGSDVFSEL